MAFFKLTMVGYQNKFNDLKENEINNKINGSNSKLTEVTIKHTRNEQSPNELYKAPITCSQEIGWWHDKNNTNEDELKWSKVEKHVFAKSEMTAFVDEMTLADKMFKLY